MADALQVSHLHITFRYSLLLPCLTCYLLNKALRPSYELLKEVSAGWIAEGVCAHLFALLSLYKQIQSTPPPPTTPISRRLDAAVSAMNAVYRRNGLPLAAFIHCLAESPVHDADLDKDNRMEVFAASDSLGTSSSQ